MKKLRKDSYFGIHFDFHAMEGETVGRVYDPEGVAELLDRVKPDFVQCDTKGHAGYSSYPTKAGTPADTIKEDVLKMWRTLTEERGIALYGHHSGIYDMMVAKNHPEWAVKNENGEISDSYISPFSPYADEILIPQLKELALDYKLDGAWIDGECWGLRVDYSSFATDKYFEKTGKKPPKRGDADYESYREFCRDGFRSYVQHYIDEIKKAAPDFQITSNWIYSSHMPEKPTVSVDFLSGDYNSSKSVDSARYNGRCLGNKGLAWDLMAWGQNARPCAWTTRNRTTKEYVQYCQEASEIISMGGAFEFFNIMYGGGGCVQRWMIPTWEKVADFVREREETCFKAQPYYEIGIVFPEERTSHDSDALYNTAYPGYKSMCAWIDAIQNIQLSCNVINEYQLCAEELEKFKVVIVPNSVFAFENSSKVISEYIRNGGKVICDLKSLSYFGDITGIDDISFRQDLIFIDGMGRLASLSTEVLDLDTGFKSTGVYYSDNYYDNSPHQAAFTCSFGKGKLVGMCFDFSGSYANNISTAIENLLRQQLDAVDFVPTVKITNNHFTDVIVAQKPGKLLINLINYSGTHNLENVRAYSEIPPLFDIKAEVKSEAKPTDVYICPGNKKVDYKFENGIISFTVDRLDIHCTAVVEY